MKKNKLIYAFAAFMLILLLVGAASATDWTTFQQDNNNIGSTSDVTSATPTKQWSFNVSGSGWLGWETAPIIANNTVYNLYFNGTVFALNLANGQEKWHYRIATSGGGDFELATPTYDSVNKRLYVATSSGNTSIQSAITALNANNGAHLWTTSSSTYPQLYRSHQLNTPVKYDSASNSIFFGSCRVNTVSTTNAGNLYCVNASNGNVKWTFNNSQGFYWAGPAIVGDYVIVGNDDGIVRVFNKNTGTPVGSYNPNDGKIRCSIVYHNNYIYFTTARPDGMGYFYKVAFNPSTGALGTAIKSSTIGRSTTTPAIAGNYAYIPNGQTLYFTNIANTTITMKSKPTYGYLQGSAAVSTGTDGYHYVYITHNDPNKPAQCFKFTNGGEYKSNSTFGFKSYTLQGVALSNGYIVYGNDNKQLSCWK